MRNIIFFGLILLLALSLLLFLLVVLNFDPTASSLWVKLVFFATLFTLLFSIFSLLYYYFINRGFVFRQCLLASIFLVGLLFLRSLLVLTYLSGTLLFLSLILIELYFWTAQGNKKGVLK
ncbi:hypothetical protein HY373_01755 [Candidatus Berkelbacteria bacterium]|nr:hypothetical protein [Candidatus Berkelbacteria bacterium]MBI2588331.1 hypothetical protein [Candidatus Berkelbacteria bacterium]MBI4029884.1 hypothetical protein [Candidatus Berkelbacteria bacterium]